MSAGIVFAFGCRPEAIKIAPVVVALRGLGVQPTIVSTGQHTDLLRGTPAETDLANSISLGIPSDGNVTRYLSTAGAALCKHFATLEDGSLVVVQGDTMSALAAAREANAQGLRVAHIEAGVRSHNDEDPWPEEINRRSITKIAAWHYAASTTAYSNLLAEGVPQTRIRLTGNPGVSALARYSSARPVRPPMAHILITLHRRELHAGEVMASILEGLTAAAKEHQEYKFIWPLHPGMVKFMPTTWIAPENVILANPMPYNDLTRLLASATGVVTDSGGVQEEAATLGVPCICLRKVTDRPESIDAVVAARMDPNAAGMAQGIEMLTHGRLERRPIDVYGLPDAAEIVARHLESLT